VHGNVRETLPEKCPTPRGKSDCTPTYKDANLNHDMCTGRAIIGVLHFKTPIDWHSKKQSTVKTATCVLEFTSAETAIQHKQGLGMTFRCLGVPIDATSYMFGDNGSVVTSSTMPDSQLNCCHLALSYHCAREAVTSGMVKFHHIPGEINPSDVLSEHWGHAELWPRIKVLQFWQGDTVDLFGSEALPVEEGKQ
jgi:hypothetical protein